jgi:hypothetical protein
MLSEKGFVVMRVLISVQWDTLPRLTLPGGQGDGSANSGFVAKLRFLNAHIVVVHRLTTGKGLQRAAIAEA